MVQTAAVTKIKNYIYFSVACQTKRSQLIMQPQYKCLHLHSVIFSVDDGSQCRPATLNSTIMIEVCSNNRENFSEQHSSVVHKCERMYLRLCMCRMPHHRAARSDPLQWDVDRMGPKSLLRVIKVSLSQQSFTTSHAQSDKIHSNIQNSLL